MLGIYVSGHPLQEYKDKMKRFVTNTSSDFYKEENEVPIVKDGQSVVVGGMITEVKIVTTKKGEAMGFVTVEDLYGQIEVIVFPKTFATVKNGLVKDEKVFIKGRVSFDGAEDAKLVAESVTRFCDTKKEIWVKFKTDIDYDENELTDLMREGTGGNDHVVVYIEDKKKAKRFSLNIDASIKDRLENRFGASNVQLKTNN